jgi:hypothetical protein
VIYFDVLLILNLVINRSSRLVILPQIVLAIALFGSEVVLNCHRLNESFVGPSFQLSPFAAFFAKCEFLVNLVFSVWVLALMVRAVQTADPTDGLKTHTHLVACVVVLFMSVGVRLVARARGFLEMQVFGWITIFGCSNVFSLALAYLHWPYAQQLSYRDGATAGVEAPQIADIDDKRGDTAEDSSDGDEGP